MSFTSIFEPVEGSFKAWLSYLRRELEAPDLWEVVRGGMAGPFFESSNDPFTSAEQSQIVLRTDAARTYLIGAGVSDDALAEANEKLDYLVEAAKRSGRMDWMNIAFSVLFGIATQGGLCPR